MSWERASGWYDRAVGERRLYYHQKIVIPGVLRLLGTPDSLLDIACGQGVLARHLPEKTKYVGIDYSPSLIKAAKQRGKRSDAQFFVEDATKPWKSLEGQNFSSAVVILALQDIGEALAVLQNAREHLEPKGKLLIVLNHPCFRIPRKSSWGVDEGAMCQYRRIDGYQTEQKIPIYTKPGQKSREHTLSYHHPLSYYLNALADAGFTLERTEEWCSDKKSGGKRAGMENRARKEIPLFLALLAVRS